jgi:hypothetical protein
VDYFIWCDRQSLTFNARVTALVSTQVEKPRNHAPPGSCGPHEGRKRAFASFRGGEPVTLCMVVLSHQTFLEASFLGFDPSQREGEARA